MQLKKISVIGVISILILMYGISLKMNNVSAVTFKNSYQCFDVLEKLAIDRTGSGAHYQMMAALNQGEMLETIGFKINDKNEQWYKVKLANGKDGWISRTMLTAHSSDTKEAVASGTILNVPLISQNPELRRGCEVTSLAMMLRYAGVNVGKMTLAAQVKKDATPYKYISGTIYFGNPNTGFVGDMYTFSHPGYGVYHGPIKALADQYLPGRVVDFSGSSFETIYQYLDTGKPVWVINNVMFDTVPARFWQRWQTPSGPISITMKEHSVLVTGYNQSDIFFNDPLANIKNRKVPVAYFKRGWEQMGRQAISYR
jgi:uncharacterized protein YvpB